MQRVTIRNGLFCDIARCADSYCNGDKESWCDQRKCYERLREYENKEEDAQKEAEGMKNGA